MELTRAQSVNRYIEEEVYTETCQWAVFPHGTTVLLTPPAVVVPQTVLALRARDVLRACGIERDSFDGIARIRGGFLVEFACKCDLPGVKILGVFPTLDKISTRYAIRDIGLDPFVVNCNPGAGVYETPCAGPGEYDEEENDDEDVVRDPSDDLGVESERRFRSCDPRSTTVDARWVRDPE